VVQISEAGGRRVPGLGEGGMGGFAKELHGAWAELPQGLTGNRAEHVSRAAIAVFSYSI
jgi:hypothetical protein